MIRPVLSISSHPESPYTVELALWLAYVGIGEVIARHRTSVAAVQHEPVRWDLVHDFVGDVEDES